MLSEATELLQRAERLPVDERLLLIEQLVAGLRVTHHAEQAPSQGYSPVDSACGVLTSDHGVSLDQMEAAIRSRAARLPS